MASPKTNLIVNYIPTSLNQDDIRKMFERLGEVATCKLIRNKITGDSLGYAFVDYINEESAKAAVTSFTGTEIQGKRLKVSFAEQLDGSSVRTGKGNLYVANLPPSVTEDKLFELFSSYGEIESRKILTNPDGSSRGAGFVLFKSKDDADSAIKEMAGKLLPDSTTHLTVKYATPTASKNQAGSLNSITSSSLVGLGVASRIPNVRFNPLAGRPQAQTAASVINSSLNASVSPVASALSGLNSHVTQSSGGGVTTVYVYGLQLTHTELTLYELFSPFGAILNVKLIRDLTKDDKPCKGYGFVNFTKAEDAYRAIASLNGVPFEEKVLDRKSVV